MPVNCMYCYYALFTDDKTKTQNLSNLPKIMQLFIGEESGFELSVISERWITVLNMNMVGGTNAASNIALNSGYKLLN